MSVDFNIKNQIKYVNPLFKFDVQQNFFISFGDCPMGHLWELGFKNFCNYKAHMATSIIYILKEVCKFTKYETFY